MKRVIGGRRYDTETAEEIAGDGYSNPGDFHHWRETLYRTKSGAWFLVGSGGPLSRYAVEVGQNEWSGGARLQPLTDAEALAWLEEHECTEALEKYFAERVVNA